jgi:hypothetical protein
MPYTERLTWGGVALHAGALPGYPSSHGCVHLPLEFAKLLFGITTLGTPVIIADGEPAYGDMQHPGLLIASHTEEMALNAVKEVSAKTAHPNTATTQTHQASSFVISTADRKVGYPLWVISGNSATFTRPSCLSRRESPGRSSPSMSPVLP